MRPIAVLFAVALLAACAGTADTRAVNGLAIACETYATALEQATVYKAKMTVEHVERINVANDLVGRACASDSTIDPRDGVAVVEQSIALVKTVKEAF